MKMSEQIYNFNEFPESEKECPICGGWAHMWYEEAKELRCAACFLQFCMDESRKRSKIKVSEKTIIERLRAILEYVCGFIAQSEIPDNGYYKQTIRSFCHELERFRLKEEPKENLFEKILNEKMREIKL